MAQGIDARGEPSDERTAAGELAASEQAALIRLGAAALDIWDQLPRAQQQKLFEDASAQPGDLDIEELRRKLALILHSHHHRTSRHLKDPEENPHPPAGPHARPDLTNFDATPGSGVLPPRRGRDKEVDPGAG